MRYGRDLEMTSDDLRSTFWTFLRFDLKWPFDLDLTPPWWPLDQRLSMDQIWSTWGQGLTSYGRDLEMTSDDLRSTFWTFLRFDLKWPFDLDLTPPWWPLGQRLSMDQIWSTWGQGLMSYGRDLEMTSDDLRSTFWTFLRFDLKWPFDLEWPWPHPPKVSLRTPNPNPFMSPSFNPVGLTVLEICLGRRTANGGRRTAYGAQAKWMLCLCLNFSGETLIWQSW